MLTLEWHLELLEEIRTRHKAWIADGLPQDSPESEEEQAPDAIMEDAGPKEEEEDEGEEDPMPLATGFAMPDVLTEFEVTQAKEAAEQQDILDSIRSEAEVEANCRFLWHGQQMTHSQGHGV